MHFSKRIIVIIATSISGLNAAPQDSVRVASAIETPTIIPGDKIAAAKFMNSFDQTYIVYQAEDTSVHLLDGNGPPVSGSTYKDTILLPAHIARNDTPLAIAQNIHSYHIFYLSDTTCPGGNYIYEWVSNLFVPLPHGSDWQNGGLNELKVCSSNQSNLLYALDPRRSGPNDPHNSAGPMRVGFMAAETNYLSELYNYDDGQGWTVAQV